MINGKRVVATISVRMNSTRLPGKVLMPLAGKPALERVFERISKSSYIDDVVIATTVNKKDDIIETFCKDRGYSYYRGDEIDVLAGVYNAAKSAQADIVYRGMGDSPLVDWRILDQLLELLVEGSFDFVANEIDEPTYPVGFDATVFTFSALEEGFNEATHPEMREHVTVHIKTNPVRYNIGALHAGEEMYWPELRLTLDTPEDYAVIAAVFDAFRDVPDFSALDVVRFLRTRQDIVAINAGVKQKVPALLSGIKN